MLSPMPTTARQPNAAALELHRSQRALVAASLLACPGAPAPTRASR
jgi:hypothetical protein